MQPDTKFTAQIMFQMFQEQNKIYKMYDQDGQVAGVHLPIINDHFLNALSYQDPVFAAYLSTLPNVSGIAINLQKDLIQLASLGFGATRGQAAYAASDICPVVRGDGWIEVPWKRGVVLKRISLPSHRPFRYKLWISRGWIVLVMAAIVTTLAVIQPRASNALSEVINIVAPICLFVGLFFLAMFVIALVSALTRKKQSQEQKKAKN